PFCGSRARIKSRTSKRCSTVALVQGYHHEKILLRLLIGRLDSLPPGSSRDNLARVTATRGRYSGLQAKVSNPQRRPVCMPPPPKTPSLSTNNWRTSLGLASSSCSRLVSKGRGAASINRAY